jgi:hypothetical protein
MQGTKVESTKLTNVAIKKNPKKRREGLVPARAYEELSVQFANQTVDAPTILNSRGLF